MHAYVRISLPYKYTPQPLSFLLHHIADLPPYLMRRPGNGLNGRTVLRVRLDGRWRTQIPDEQPVIVATGREVLPIGRPFQSAYLLRVTCELPRALRARPWIPLEDAVVTATGADDVVVPRDGACVWRVRGREVMEGRGGRRRGGREGRVRGREGRGEGGREGRKGGGREGGGEGREEEGREGRKGEGGRGRRWGKFPGEKEYRTSSNYSNVLINYFFLIQQSVLSFILLSN